MESAKGLPLASILVFPALFTAAMALVDATDSLMMLGVYGWATRRPARTLYYNLAVTAASVVIAVTIGAAQLVQLAGARLGDLSDLLSSHSETVGGGMALAFALVWIAFASLLLARRRGGRLEAKVQRRRPS